VYGGRRDGEEREGGREGAIGEDRVKTGGGRKGSPWFFGADG